MQHPRIKVIKTISTLFDGEIKQVDSAAALLWYVQAEGEKGKVSIDFSQISAAARTSERLCDFALAAALWNVASERARKELNKMWARKRSERCLIMDSYKDRMSIGNSRYIVQGSCHSHGKK